MINHKAYLNCKTKALLGTLLREGVIFCSPHPFLAPFGNHCIHPMYFGVPLWCFIRKKIVF